MRWTGFPVPHTVAAMNRTGDQTTYVTCRCQHCDGGIEFDSSGFDENETRTVPCPHCKLETTISVEKQSIPHVDSPSDEISDVSQEDYLRLLKWYRKAAEQGDSFYQTELAMAICAGLGATQDHVEATFWFQKSAEQGNQLAQFNLGACYWKGQGVEKNHEIGVKWFLKAANQGDGTAQRILGECYEQGDGAEQNLVEAYKWAKLAAAQNEKGAQEICDKIISKMSKEEMDNGQKLFETFEAKINDATKFTGVEYFDLIRRFANQGDIEAQQFLAQFCGNRGEAMKWTRMSAEIGSALAQYRLGIAYLSGDGVPENHAEGVNWLVKAAKQGSIVAHYQLGLAYCHGIGVPQNYIEAYRFANMAAAKGIEEARNLREMLLGKMSANQIALAQRPSTEQVDGDYTRQAIPSEVRREVWRRDHGKCVKCGSREKLEYDHIIPVAKGGSNTVRNIELLCESCNRMKSASIQ
jgi:TPR repeat protein